MSQSRCVCGVSHGWPDCTLRGGCSLGARDDALRVLGQVQAIGREETGEQMGHDLKLWAYFGFMLKQSDLSVHSCGR